MRAAIRQLIKPKLSQKAGYWIQLYDICDLSTRKEESFAVSSVCVSQVRPTPRIKQFKGDKICSFVKHVARVFSCFFYSREVKDKIQFFFSN